MKKLTLVLFIAIAITACKKEETVQPQQSVQVQQPTTYAGKYAIVGSHLSAEDTIVITINNSTYHADHLNSEIGDNILLNVTGSSIVIPKASYYPNSTFIIEGTGTFTDSTVTFDYTTDRNDYNSMFHSTVHSVYKKQ